jgi:hypothetical protein
MQTHTTLLAIVSILAHQIYAIEPSPNELDKWVAISIAPTSTNPAAPTVAEVLIIPAASPAPSTSSDFDSYDLGTTDQAGAQFPPGPGEAFAKLEFLWAPAVEPTVMVSLTKQNEGWGADWDQVSIWGL